MGQSTGAGTSGAFIRDRDAWTSAVRSHGLDVYYEYDYVALDLADGDVAELFVCSHPGGTLLHPYVCRSITGTPYSDTVTAYGYGGPVLRGDWTRAQVLEAKETFRASCRSRSIVTETIRFHPLLDQTGVGPDWVDTYRRRQSTTYVDLRRPLPEVLGDIDKQSQRSIRKAEREAVTVRPAGSGGIETFVPLYWETMDKRHAAERYYFGPQYFETIFASDRLDAEFLFAEWHGEVIAGCLVLYGPELAHYHLGASAREHLSHRPNHLLFREMITRSSARGKRALHLGGGATPAEDDSLLSFKKSFTGSRQEQFVLGESVFDQSAFLALCEELTPAPAGATPWFPPYRRPAVQAAPAASAHP